MTRTAPTVLVVEDDAPIRRFLRAALGESGYRVEEALTAAQALDALINRPPDLVLLDLGLPDRDGLDLLRELRGWSRVPVIVLSARDREHDKVVALDAGADDYLSKPFGVAELRARMRVALRHAAAAGGDAGSASYTAGDLHVDLAARRVTVGGREVHLTPHEYKLLALLVTHAGKVLTHRQLLREVWGPEYGDENHYVRVYMAQLRRKIEADPARPRHIRSEPGVGYRLVEEG
ncbi:MAG: response regulator [Thermoanaerobaculaceae bacterium]|jgi:two-component system KDP operon response regulator KdpE|nr:response regulator [Thermoanaerobaculaceae bacterium]